MPLKKINQGTFLCCSFTNIKSFKIQVDESLHQVFCICQTVLFISISHSRNNVSWIKKWNTLTVHQKLHYLENMLVFETVNLSVFFFFLHSTKIKAFHLFIYTSRFALALIMSYCWSHNAYILYSIYVRHTDTNATEKPPVLDVKELIRRLSKENWAKTLYSKSLSRVILWVFFFYIKPTVQIIH